MQGDWLIVWNWKKRDDIVVFRHCSAETWLEYRWFNVQYHIHCRCKELWLVGCILIVRVPNAVFVNVKKHYSKGLLPLIDVICIYMLLCRQWSGLHEILSTLCLLLIWVALCMRPQKTEAPCHSTRGTIIKDPFLIIGLSAERRPKFCNFSQPKMTSPYDRAKKTLQIIKAFSYRIDIVVQASNTLFAV